eukprot:277048_1
MMNIAMDASRCEELRKMQTAHLKKLLKKYLEDSSNLTKTEIQEHYNFKTFIEKKQFVKAIIRLENYHTSKQKYIDDNKTNVCNNAPNSNRKSNRQKQKQLHVDISNNLVDIGFLQFSTFGWKCVQNDQHEKTWICDSYPVALSYNYCNQPPDIPKPSNITEVRQKYRKEMETSGIVGGLIICEKIRLNDVMYGIEVLTKYIINFPNNTKSGYIYAVTIPFKTCSIVLKLQTTYAGQTTGVRDSKILMKLMQELKVNPIDLGQIFNCDPYDAKYKTGNQMNLSELEKYDHLFPMHPLSVIRQTLIPKLKQSIKLNANDANFKKLYFL